MTGSGVEAPALRVASFNIRNGIAWDGLDSWPLRRQATAATVAELEADLLGLQEVYGFQQRYLLRRLAGYAATGAGRTDGRRRGERCAVLYRTARLRLDQMTTRWFSDTPDVPGSTGWGNRLPRIVTLACFTDLVGGGGFGFADCHLEGSPAAARHRSATALATWLDPCLPWIVAGDLNAEPHDAAVRALLDAGLRDVFAPGVAARRPAARQTPGGGPAARPSPPAAHTGTPAAHTGTPAAHTGTPAAAPVTTVAEPRSGGAGRRIDYLLVTREWEVVAAAVPAPGRHRRRASDHLPVLATVRLRTGAALPTLEPTATGDPLEEQR